MTMTENIYIMIHSLVQRQSSKVRVRKSMGYLYNISPSRQKISITKMEAGVGGRNTEKGKGWEQRQASITS
jgi:hypothetical protein